MFKKLKFETFFRIAVFEKKILIRLKFNLYNTEGVIKRI